MKKTSKYKQNDGKKGVVYILTNPALQNNFYKIGQSTRSGAIRAIELNKQSTTAMPAEYTCIFEYQTIDCGKSERLVHKILAAYRRGKGGQEFFNVEIKLAKKTIKKVCDEINKQKNLLNFRQDNYFNKFFQALIFAVIIIGGVLSYYFSENTTDASYKHINNFNINYTDMTKKENKLKIKE
jgi:hypothetical protein